MNIFHHTDRLAKGLDVSWLKMEVNAQNIANADTPGYDAMRVEFDEQYKAALERSINPSGVFPTKRTDTRHVEFSGGAVDPDTVRPTVVTDDYYVMRMDDNNVDVDKEMVEMAKNTIQYNALVQKVNSELAKLKTVIKG